MDKTGTGIPAWSITRWGAIDVGRLPNSSPPNFFFCLQNWPDNVRKYQEVPCRAGTSAPSEILSITRIPRSPRRAPSPLPMGGGKLKHRDDEVAVLDINRVLISPRGVRGNGIEQLKDGPYSHCDGRHASHVRITCK